MHLHNATPLFPFVTFTHRSRLALGAVADWSPDASATWVRDRDLAEARFILEQAIAAYDAARAQIGATNRMCGKRSHCCPNAQRRRLLISQDFATLNRRRGALVRARKALAALVDACGPSVAAAGLTVASVAPVAA